MAEQRQVVVGYLAAAGTLIVWTAFVLVSRLGGKSALTPFDVLALRLIVAGLVLLPFAASLPAGAWRDRRLWFLSLLGGMIYCLICYGAYKFAPAAHGAILLSGTQPFLVAVIVWLIAGTRPTRLRLVGLAGIAAGVACAAVPHFMSWQPQTLVGDLLMVVSSVIWAWYTVLAQRWGFGPWVLTRAVALFSALVYLPLYTLFLPKALAATPWSMIVLQGAFQGIGATILAMLLYLKAIACLGAERTTALLAMVPVVAGFAAVPLLDEALTVWLVCGLLFVSCGAFVASRPARNVA